MQIARFGWMGFTLLRLHVTINEKCTTCIRITAASNNSPRLIHIEISIIFGMQLRMIQLNEWEQQRSTTWNFWSMIWLEVKQVFLFLFCWFFSVHSLSPPLHQPLNLYRTRFATDLFLFKNIENIISNNNIKWNRTNLAFYSLSLFLSPSQLESCGSSISATFELFIILRFRSETINHLFYFIDKIW